MTTWIAIALSVVVSLLMTEAAQASSAIGPRDAVESAVDRFMNLQNSRSDNAPLTAERLGQIREIVRDMFDFDEISRRALARHWQTLQREEQAEFVTLFRDLLERAYLAQVETVGNEKIVFLGESSEGDGAAIVRSKVVTRQGTQIPLDYRLHLLDGRWRIYDVVVQGISFIASYRTQFDRVIRAESYGALRERLQKRAAENTAAQR
jgi:phospholipid transport system substrate-binding protein